MRKLLRESLLAQVLVLCLAFCCLVGLSWSVVFVHASWEVAQGRKHQDVSNEGQAAARDGLALRDNPYGDIQRRAAWESGHRAASDAMRQNR